MTAAATIARPVDIAQRLADVGIQTRDMRRGTRRQTCPRCSHDRRKSNLDCLSVTIDGEGATWFCHHCGFRGGVSREDAGERPAGGTFRRPRPEPAPVPAERPDDYIGPFYNPPRLNYEDAVWAAANGFDGGDPATLAKIAEAFDDFEAALPVPGSIAETYVRARIPGLADDFAWNHDAIRFEPEAGHPYNKRSYPALICKAIRARTAQFCGVQRIYLQDDGSSRLPDEQRGRLSFGRLINAVCKLSPQRAEDGEIIITEGVVKGLAAIDCGIPGVVCAALGTSGLAGFPHLAGVSRLGIIPDRDDAGRQAAEALAHRYRWRGTPVRIVAPPWGKDLDDFIREGTA